MSDKSDSLDALATVRKRCPQCGHENHLMAKVCVNCGYEFPLTAPTQMDGTEKICPKCGHANRAGAKICSQCGTALPVGVAPPAPTPAVGATVTRAKKCPDCGMVCKLDAKVCPNCGHRFQTDFFQTGQAQPNTPSPRAITEPPVVQMPSVGMALPPQFDALSHMPDLPPDPTPPAPTPPLADPSMVDPSAHNSPNVSADADADTSGEPAPDLSELDIEALRRRSPDHSDSSGRVNISFRKDRS